MKKIDLSSVELKMWQAAVNSFRSGQRATGNADLIFGPTAMFRNRVPLPNPNLPNQYKFEGGVSKLKFDAVFPADPEYIY